MKKTLKAMKNHYGDNVSIVFGCGGNRDFKKRPIMGSIANSMCKKIYVTDDNPRSENPKKIRKEIIKISDFQNILILEIELKQSKQQL